MNSAGMGVTIFVPVCRLALAHDGKRRQHAHHDEDEGGDDAGNEEPLALDVFVVPRALVEHDLRREAGQLRRHALQPVVLVILRKALGNLVDVAHGNQRCVGVRGVHHHLQRRARLCAASAQSRDGFVRPAPPGRYQSAA
jgi:hypothetical protein